MIKTFINGSAESVEYTDTPSFNAPPSNIDVYMLASVDAISPPDAREWDFTVDIPSERISTLPNGYTIMIADTREAIESGFGYKTLFKKSENYGIEHYRVKVNAPFYIGVGNTDVAISPGDLSIYTVETFLDSHFAFTILGESAKCILFKDDTEPCAVYVNGERQDNISYIPTLAEGADTVSYKSEYKNNLRTLQIKGNTEQKTYGGYNLFDIDAVTGITDSVGNPPSSTFGTITDGVMHLKYGLYYHSTYWLGAKIPIRQGGNYYISCDVLIEEASLSPRIYASLENVSKNANLPYIQSNDIVKGAWTRYTFPAQAVPDKWVGDEVYLMLNARGTEDQYLNIPIYAKNVMVTYDNDTDVYEQYYGGTGYPSIKYPQAITNCSNGQIEVDVKGVNLFDIDNPFLVVENSYHLAFAPKIENGIIYGGGRLSLSDGAYLCVKTDGKSKYTFTYNVDFDETTETTRVHRFGLFSDVANGVASKYFLLNRVSGITKGKKTVTIDCQGYEYIGVTWYSNTRYGIEITELQIEKGDIATPYEPYFNSTVSIPANVVLERDGNNETLLELAKIGDIADTITIDRVNNEVKYIQRMCRVRPFVNVGGTLSYAGAMPTHNVFQFALNQSANMGEVSLAKCEFAKVLLTDSEVIGLDANTLGIFFPSKDLVYIYFPISLGLTSVQALEEYLTQTGMWGIGIFYVLDESVEWSLTDYEASLMELARNTKNQTNIIEITSTPSVSKTSVNYAKWGGVPNENNT